LAIAKARLCEDIEKLQLDKWPRPCQHRDGDGRTAKEVNDIMLMFNFLDEKLQLDSLPIYVCENPDRMPTTRWMDGDLQLLIAKLNSLERENNELKVHMGKIEQSVEVICRQNFDLKQLIDSIQGNQLSCIKSFAEGVNGSLESHLAGFCGEVFKSVDDIKRSQASILEYTANLQANQQTSMMCDQQDFEQAGVHQPSWASLMHGENDVHGAIGGSGLHASSGDFIHHGKTGPRHSQLDSIVTDSDADSGSAFKEVHSKKEEN